MFKNQNICEDSIFRNFLGLFLVVLHSNQKNFQGKHNFYSNNHDLFKNKNLKYLLK